MAVRFPKASIGDRARRSFTGRRPAADLGAGGEAFLTAALDLDAGVGSKRLLTRHGQPIVRELIEVDGGPIAFAEIGDGDRVVVLVHGVMTALDDMLLALADHLAGCRIIAFDRPGFGLSRRRALADAGVLRQARSLNAALNGLGVETGVLVGHSFGGPVALAMAMAAPERALGVVPLAPLVVPGPRLEHLLFGPRGSPVLGGWLAGWSHAGLDAQLLPLLWRCMFLPQAMPAVVDERFPFVLAGAAGASARVGEDSLAVGPDLIALLTAARGFDKPLHVLGGAADLVVNNLLHGQTLARLAPQGRFTLLPGVGHMIHHVAPTVVAEAVTTMFET
jgi:pimeloyl-ACP methyl ester carboxylesterase